MSQVRLVATNITGLPMGESHWCAHPEALVQQARAMHAQGISTRAIAQLLNGPHAATVWRWVSGTGRKPPAKVVARRIKTSPAAGMAERSSAANPHETLLSSVSGISPPNQPTNRFSK